MTKKHDSQSAGSSSFSDRFRSFLIAAILANLASAVALFVDSIIVGQIMGPSGLAAITSLQPVNQFIYSLTILLNTGAAIMTAYALGACDFGKVRGLFSFASLLNAGAAVILLLTGLFFTENIVKLLGNDPQIFDSAISYGRVMIICSGLMVFMFSISGFLRTDNASGLVTRIVVITNAVNLCCDIIFMKFLGWGIAGAAWATAVGYAAGIICFLPRFKNKECHLALTREWEDIPKFSTIIVGLPLVIDTLCMFLRMLMVNRMLLNQKAAAGLAALSVGMNILLLVNLFLGGAGQAMQGVGGACLGAGDHKGYALTVRRSTRLIIAVSIVVLVIVELIPRQIASIFNLDADMTVLEESVTALRLFALSLPGFGIAFIFEVSALIRKLTFTAMIIAIFHSLTVAAVMAIIIHSGAISLWHSFWIGETLGAFLSASAYFIGKYVKKRSELPTA